LIVRRARRIWSALLGAAALGSLWLPAAATATTQSMVVQPDGKIVLLGQVWPEAGAVGRLEPDGSIDRGFGDRGFVVDHRLPGFRAVGLAPDGRIVGAAVGGFNLARYLSDGTPDPSFAGGGAGGSDEPDQEHVLDGGYGPSAMVIRPDGGIVVAGSHPLDDGDPGPHPVAEGVNTESWVRRYDSAGSLLETVGGISTPSPGAQLELTDLLEAPGGALIGAGSTYNYDGKQLVEPILARFVPGSGSDFDPSFGGGAGLVRPSFPRKRYEANNFRAIAAGGGGLLAAGQAMGTFLLARFDWEGRLDPSFGEGGFAAPTIDGPATRARTGKPRSWAEDLAVAPDGGILLGGGTSQWARWVKGRSGAECIGCGQPMLTRFDANGRLDPSFGNGGLLRLRRPGGDILPGRVEQVVPLADGTILVTGPLHEWAKFALFVARLNRDGSYDPSFGDGGLVTPRFPCRDKPGAFHYEPGCLPSLKVKLVLGRANSHHPVLSLRARPSFDWVAINSLAVTLPEAMRLAPGFKSKVRVRGASEVGRVRAVPAKPGERGPVVFVEGLGNADEVRLRLGGGAIAVPDPLNQRSRPAFKVWAEFNDARWNIWAGKDRVVRRVG
jgi:uncharacterized delta-60 repeat protein